MLEQIFEKLDESERGFLRNLIYRDELTGLYNRSFFNQVIETEVHRVARSDSSVSLMLVDIDNFKKYQDKHSRGHLGGDEVLKQVAKTLVKGLRDFDLVCRYGGEEIAIVCPDTSLQDGFNVANRLRQSVQDSCPVTISLGLANYPENSANAVDLVYKADRGLYLAKSLGRNMCKIADPSSIQA